MAFASAICLGFYLQYRNSQARIDAAASSESEGRNPAEQYEDRTDREIPGFIYLF
jgi:hypothetical protein